MSEGAVSIQTLPQMLLFRRVLPLQVRLQEIVRLLGGTQECRCLCVGDHWGAISHYLQQRGGQWSFVVLNPAAHETVEEVLGAKVAVLEKQALPFKNKMFDVVVLVGGLEGVADDRAVIEDCHRVLKADGRFVVCVPHRKSWSPVYAVRRMFGRAWDRQGLARQGYTESDLFHILKDGFDVVHMRTFSRFFVELTDALFGAAAGPTAVRADIERARGTLAIGGVFYRIADQIDMLLFMTRGFTLVASAKRRAWLPRKTPVLGDGRSIGEAVLSRIAN